MKRFPVLFFIIICACSSPQNETIISKKNDKEIVETIEQKTEVKAFDYNLDSVYAVFGLVNVKEIDSTIQVDLKYASTNNFMGVLLYDTISQAYLQKSVALRLKKSQSYLTKLHPGYKLLIYDAVRPVSVQVKMWNALDSIPAYERGKFVSNPKNRSVHNYGCAVDVTIVDSNGVELDMGAGYDDFRPIAFPSKEKEFLEAGLLTSKQLSNRKLLRAVMRKSYFYNIPSEWWHFNAFNRDKSKSKFPCLLNESGSVSLMDTTLRNIKKDLI